MEELEKDIKSNYSNIIKLMEIDPFYEIMHRYNSKVTKIRQVFTSIKNQPAEIPENPLRVKNEETHEHFLPLCSFLFVVRAHASAISDATCFRKTK